VTDLRRLQYFLAVARERNFTRAAEQLHIAPGRLAGPRVITYEIYRVN
jgi:DNA-binding transcriptional LysR family regulator